MDGDFNWDVEEKVKRRRGDESGRGNRVKERKVLSVVWFCKSWEFVGFFSRVFVGS